MAAGKLLGGKPSGGVTTVTFQDGVSNTELVLPESGTVASTDGATVDNTLPRYDGVSGKLQGSSVTISDSSNMIVPGGILSTGLMGIGYGTGAGGTVTQLTSKATAVTLNKPSGRIITSSSALGAGVTVAFTLNNTLLTGNDNIKVIVGGAGAAGAYQADCTYCINGAANITIKNLDSISRTDAFAINFTIIKGASS